MDSTKYSPRFTCQMDVRGNTCYKYFFNHCNNQHRTTLFFLAVFSVLVSGCSFSNVASSAGRSTPNVDLFLLSIEAQRAYQQSQWFKAVSLYQKIVEYVPTDALAWFRLANTYARQGEYEKAIHAYEQSLLNNNDQPKAWYNLSTAYLLRAQSAMQLSRSQLSHADPARKVIQQRLLRLEDLLIERIVNTRLGSPGQEPAW